MKRCPVCRRFYPDNDERCALDASSLEDANACAWSELLRAREGFGVARAVRLSAALCDALEGAAPRTVRPGDVLIEATGGAGDERVGLAAREGDAETIAPYAAPEVLRGEAPTPASAVYNAAVILYESLTGRAPFSGSPAGLIVRQRLERPAPPGALHPGLDARLDALIVRALDRDPSVRPASPAAFAHALRALRIGVAEVPPLQAFANMGEPRAAERREEPPAPRVWLRPALLGATLLGAALFVVVAVGLTSGHRDPIARRTGGPMVSVRARHEVPFIGLPNPTVAPVQAEPPVAQRVLSTTPEELPAPQRSATPARTRRASPSSPPARSPRGPGAPIRRHAPPRTDPPRTPREVPAPASQNARMQPLPEEPTPPTVAVVPAAPETEAPSARGLPPSPPPAMTPPSASPSLRAEPQRPPESPALWRTTPEVVVAGALVALLLVAALAFSIKRAVRAARASRRFRSGDVVGQGASEPPSRPTAPLDETLPTLPLQPPLWRPSVPQSTVPWDRPPGDAAATLDDTCAETLKLPETPTEALSGEREAPTETPIEPFTIGQYVCEYHLGEGAMGVVYKARDARQGRVCAVKVLAPRGAINPAAVERFRREARLAASVRHPNSVAVYDYGEVDGALYYLAMEYLQGRSLKDVMGARPMSLPRAVAYVRQLCDGLEAAHRAGVVHRDLKPHNVMVCEQPGLSELVKVVDFGIARDLDASERTMTGAIVGTPLYMAPEQARGELDVDARADVFSLGVMTFEMLTGQYPFPVEVGVVQQVLKRAMQKAPARSVCELRPDLPVEVDGVLARALEIEPERRTPSAAEFGAGLALAARRAA
jgi:serine/threonine-protein kinase